MPCKITQSSDQFGPVPLLLNSHQNHKYISTLRLGLHPILSLVVILLHSLAVFSPSSKLPVNIPTSFPPYQWWISREASVLLTGPVINLATAGLTLRSRERSKGPRASVAACPARSTRQAERLRWILHTFSRRNFPSSVGPTTRFSPSRQIPLPRAEEQDRVHQERRKKFHPPRST